MVLSLVYGGVEENCTLKALFDAEERSASGSGQRDVIFYKKQIRHRRRVIIV